MHIIVSFLYANVMAKKICVAGKKFICPPPHPKSVPTTLNLRPDLLGIQTSFSG